MKYFSIFTGVGGFEQGLPRNWNCVGFSEVNKYCNMVLAYHWPSVKNYGDVNEIRWKKIPNFDLLVGGSPCQDVSVSGKRKGLNAERSRLFFQYIECLKAKKPGHFVFENVEGLLNSNRGFDMARVLTEFSEAGYDFQWQVLNSEYFNVPQARHRVFIVGHLRGQGAKEIFYKYQKGQAVADLSNTLLANYHKGWNPVGASKNYALIEVTRKNSQGQRVYSSRGLSITLSSGGGGLGAKTGLYLMANRIRRLTPLECERLMGWPDDWTRYGIDQGKKLVEISDTQRYRMCGNGVVSTVARQLIGDMFGE